MTQFEEGNLIFYFGQGWQDHVRKFDAEKVYEKTKNAVEQTKGVDFLGIYGNELYLIEVKDFRGHRIPNKQRLTSGELAMEIAQKVRDSVACIVGAYRTESTQADWQIYAQLLFGGQLRVILWLERDDYHNRAVMNHLRTDLKNRLSWLNVKVEVAHLRAILLPDIQVKNKSSI